MRCKQKDVAVRNIMVLIAAFVSVTGCSSSCDLFSKEESWRTEIQSVSAPFSTGKGYLYVTSVSGEGVTDKTWVVDPVGRRVVSEICYKSGKKDDTTFFYGPKNAMECGDRLWILGVSGHNTERQVLLFDTAQASVEKELHFPDENTGRFFYLPSISKIALTHGRSYSDGSPIDFFDVLSKTYDKTIRFPIPVTLFTQDPSGNVWVFGDWDVTGKAPLGMFALTDSGYEFNKKYESGTPFGPDELFYTGSTFLTLADSTHVIAKAYPNGIYIIPPLKAPYLVTDDILGNEQNGIGNMAYCEITGKIFCHAQYDSRQESAPVVVLRKNVSNDWVIDSWPALNQGYCISSISVGSGVLTLAASNGTRSYKLSFYETSTYAHLGDMTLQ